MGKPRVCSRLLCHLGERAAAARASLENSGDSPVSLAPDDLPSLGSPAALQQQIAWDELLHTGRHGRSLTKQQTCCCSQSAVHVMSEDVTDRC